MHSFYCNIKFSKLIVLEAIKKDVIIKNITILICNSLLLKTDNLLNILTTKMKMQE